MQREIIPLKTILCGTAAAEQLSYELTIRGIRRPWAVAAQKELKQAGRVLSRALSGFAAEDLFLATPDEELPPDADALILLGSVPDSAKSFPGITIRIPLRAADLEQHAAGSAEILIIDRRAVSTPEILDRFFRNAFVRFTGIESSYPFPLRIPRFFSYANDTLLVWGDSALFRLGPALEQDGTDAPLLITDSGVSAAGITEKLLQSLPGIIRPLVFDEVPPDSSLDLIRTLTALYRREERNGIVALGGGSVLDTAKGVAAAAGLSAETLQEWEGSNIMPRISIPFYAVPTTSGTGSESTKVAVISDPEEERKRLFVSPFLQPKMGVLDSTLSASLPPVLTTTTGMDALCHAVEAFTCLGKNPMSDLAAWHAVELIAGHLEAAVREPAELSHRRAMALASTLAGQAFSNSMVGVVHSTGHAVGSVCHAPHGSCMSVLLPHGLACNLEYINPVLGELLIPLRGREQYDAHAPEQRGREVIEALHELNRTLRRETGGLHPTRLREITGRDGTPLVTPKDFSHIADIALGDASLVYNPREMRKQEIMELLEAAY